MKNKTAVKSLCLILFSVFLLILTLNHEYWFDEGQAWNIARDNDIAGIFSMMKYEGHPPLWYLILKLFTSLGCSWRALGLVSWGIMTITAGIILFCLPLRPCLQAALLLSSGMLYINSVISRVYCVIYLLLAVLALLYPRRKKHPILFGLTVALLADTHICMCGLVGIIGIFMLIEFFKEFKSNSRRQNALNAFGLLIAGAGVVVLVLPLIGSLKANCFASTRQFTPGGIFTSFILSFSQITYSGISPNLPDAIGIVLSIVAQLALILAVILLRRNRRSFTMLLVFAAFYMVVSGVIWYATPNRGALFIYVPVMIWIMGAEEEVRNKPCLKIKSGSKTVSSLVSLFNRLDSNAEKSLSVLFAVVLALSIPSGIKYAVQDLCGEFDPSKAAAEFIRENIPEDALLVSYNDDYSALTTYLPERKIYSLTYGRFYSFSSHEMPPEELDREAFFKAAEWYNEVWFIDWSYRGDPTMIYSNNNSISFYLAAMDIGIFRMTKEEFAVKYFK